MLRILGIDHSEVRENISVDHDDLFLLLIDLIDMLNEEPTPELVRKAEETIFQLLGVFITFIGEDEDILSTLQRRQHIARLVPASTLAKCFGCDRNPHVLTYAAKIFHIWRKFDVYSTMEVISILRANPELLDKLKLMLESSNVVPNDVCLLVADILTKTVAFDFAHDPHAQAGNVASFEKWEKEIDWHTDAAKFLEENGVLEAAFQHLRDITRVKAATYHENLGAQSPEIFSFYIVDGIVFSDGLRSEVETVLNRLRGEVKDRDGKLREDWFLQVDQDRCQEICQPSSAVLRIREKIPDAVQILDNLEKLLPQRFVAYSKDRFAAVKRAIMGKEEWDKVQADKHFWSQQKKDSAPGSKKFANLPPSNWGSSSSAGGSTWGTTNNNNNQTVGSSSASPPATFTWGQNTSSSGWGQKKEKEEPKKEENNNNDDDNEVEWDNEDETAVKKKKKKVHRSRKF